MRAPIFILALAIPAFACGQSATLATAHDQHQKAFDPHASDVATRGDHAMGVSHKYPPIIFAFCPMVGQSN